jgi:hypothetical protein
MSYNFIATSMSISWSWYLRSDVVPLSLSSLSVSPYGTPRVPPV